MRAFVPIRAVFFGRRERVSGRIFVRERKGDNAVWLNNLAQVQLSIGKLREAADTTQKAVRLCDNLVAAHETQARVKAAPATWK